MILYDTHNTRITLGQEVACGSNATLIEVMGEPTLLAKQYTSSPDDYEVKLTWMMAHLPVSSRSEEEAGVGAWPEARLYNSRGKFAGYLLPYLSSGVALHDIFIPKRRQERFPELTRKHLHRIAYYLAEAVEAVHEQGYVIGALNERHILVTSPAWVTLIGTDDFQVRTFRLGQSIFLSQANKVLYTPPELQGQHSSKLVYTTAHDNFALGVLRNGD